MKQFTQALLMVRHAGFAAASACLLLGCGLGPHATESDETPQLHTDASEGLPVIAADADTPRPPFNFSAEDDALLDTISRGSFRVMWEMASPDTGMVYDRSNDDVVSVAGVGFQLSAIPIGVERGWITREEGEARALQILQALRDGPENRKAGLFYHFLRPEDAGPRRIGTELVVSTIDSAILFAGMLVSAEYFDGDVRTIAETLVSEADWSFFLRDPGSDNGIGQYVSLGWRPADDAHPAGDGELIPFVWLDNGDEHKLVSFMGVMAPEPAHRLGADRYYALRRQLGEHAATGPFVWFPWSSALFTTFFAHCWISYAAMEPDDPAAFGMPGRPSVDWWENSRRYVNFQRATLASEYADVPTFAAGLWGLTACDGPTSYLVPGVFPPLLVATGQVAGRDYSTYTPADKIADGTVAPYGVGASVLFEPEASIKTLRAFIALRDAEGKPLVWDDPAEGGMGLRDSVNLAGPGGERWAAHTHVAIDHGPMLLAIENARTGLVWDLFSRHRWVQAAESRLGFVRK